jgi:hypothetical protein
MLLSFKKTSLLIFSLTLLSWSNVIGQTPSEPTKLLSGKSVNALPAEKARPVHIPRLEKAPIIDGQINDEAWKGAAVFNDFYQVEPGDNLPPSQPTEVLMGYDSKSLYIAFRAHDEPGKVRATIPKRDDILSDDNVEVVIDTYNDQRKAYEFFFNPFGVQADAVLTEGRGEDFSVDIVMDSKGLVTNDGYTVEVAIPFKSLRYEAGKEHLWGIHLFRRIKRFSNELDSWMPISRDKSGTLNQAGHITGLQGLSTERTIEIIPSLTLSETGRRVRTLTHALVDNDPTLQDPGRLLNPAIGFDPGVTAKFGITPTISLDLAINPDFAQIEADETVITANQRFPIFFDEKRPFFLEGKDIFQTRLTPVHTRAIVDPDYAVKLTGKQGRNTFGLLLASDNAPGNFSEDERDEIVENLRDGGKDSRTRLLDRNATIGILRLKRDIGRENSLGFIATTYNFVDKHNNLGGFDGRFRINPQTVFDFQVLGTSSRRSFRNPDLGHNVYRTGNGLGYYYSYDNRGRHFGYTLNGEGRTRDYRADVGFTLRTNSNIHKLTLRYNSEPKPKATFIAWHAANTIAVTHDWQARMQRWDEQPQVTLNFSRQTSLTLGTRYGYERLFEEEFGVKRTPIRQGAFAGNDAERSTYKKTIFASGGTTPSKKYSAAFYLSYDWSAFDFDSGAGPRFPRVSPGALLNPNAPRDPGSADLLDVELSLTYQPTNAFRASLDYTKNTLTRRENNRVVYTDNIYTLRGTYQFSRFTFARARVDYDSLDSNVRGQFLLGWAPNPGTSFYVGYNDDLNVNGFNPFTGQLEPGFRRNGRTFFIKFSYLFRHSF